LPTTHAGEQSDASARHPNAAVALVRTLETLGVEFLFGMDAPAAVQAVLTGSDIRSITVRDERSGAFMADGYAKVSGKPGVMGIGGVGATNTIQGVVESSLSSTPVVLLVEEGSGATRHKNDLQDIDRAPMFTSITRWAGEIERPERVADLTEYAFHVATSGRPGPVYVGCPWDVVSGNTEPVPVGHPEPSVYPSERSAPDPADVAEAAGMLATAERPVIVAGGGALLSGATEALARLARMLGAAVATTPAGKGSIDEFDALAAGVVGSYASGPSGHGRVANETVRAADLVLLVGTSTGSGATAGWTVPDPSQATVHLDVDPAEIGRNYRGSLPLVGDARLGLEALAAAIDGPRREPWADGSARAQPEPTSGERLDPVAIYAALQQAMDDETIIVADAGYCGAWALDLLRFRAPGRRFLSPSAYGTLGYGFPAAIGAKLAAPSSTVVCVTGDGGFGYSLAELETAARYEIAVTVIVLNNSALAWSRQYDRHFYGYEGETRFTDVDHAAVARGLGCEGIRVTTADGLAPAIEKAMASGTTTVIDALTDPDARAPVDMFD
jgi:acetolactate synthase-1/2/3 large subunit